MAATDKELAEVVKVAAMNLAQAMNMAADAGLLIEIEMKPHSCVADTQRVYKRGSYRPILSISRVMYPLDEAGTH